MLMATAARAESPDESLQSFAVNIHQTPMQTWGVGYGGIYLWRGLFITAAHVAGHSWITRPKVAIEGREYPTRVAKEGSLEGTDLTVLSVEPDLLPMRLQLRKNRLCKEPPWPGEEVTTVVPEFTARSHVISPSLLPPSVRRFSTVIADVARTANSGSGVFDVKMRCLLGIMSRKISSSRLRRDTGKIEMIDIAKYFVPASEIATFLADDPNLVQ
jgi:hypothetical protein